MALLRLRLVGTARAGGGLLAGAFVTLGLGAVVACRAGLRRRSRSLHGAREIWISARQRHRERIAAMVDTVAAMPGPIVSVLAAGDGPLAYPLDWLLEEVSTSINTTAAGGNASLMMIG